MSIYGERQKGERRLPLREGVDLNLRSANLAVLLEFVSLCVREWI